MLWKQKNQIVNLRVIWNGRFRQNLLKTVLILYRLHPFIFSKVYFFIYLSKKLIRSSCWQTLGKFSKSLRLSTKLLNHLSLYKIECIRKWNKYLLRFFISSNCIRYICSFYDNAFLRINVRNFSINSLTTLTTTHKNISNQELFCSKIWKILHLKGGAQSISCKSKFPFKFATYLVVLV